MKTLKLLLIFLMAFTSCSKDDADEPITEETIEYAIGYNSATSEISVNGGAWMPSVDFDTFVSVNDFSAAPNVDFGVLHSWDDFTINIVSDQHELHSIVTISLLPSYTFNNEMLIVSMPDLRDYFDEVDSVVYFTIRVKAN